MNCFVTIIAKENQNQNPKTIQISNPNHPNPKLTQNPKPKAISKTQKPKGFGVGTCLVAFDPKNHYFEAVISVLTFSHEWLDCLSSKMSHFVGNCSGYKFNLFK
jgi:hypothetical protein